MAKLTGAKKKAFLARMAKGRAAKSGAGPKIKRRKSARPSSKSVQVKRKSTPRKSNNMKRKSRRSRARSAGGKLLGNPTLKKAMIGIGASALAGTVVGMVAPQFAPIAKPLAGFATGGIVGGIASLILSGDGLGALGGIFGGGSSSSVGLSV